MKKIRKITSILTAFACTASLGFSVVSAEEQNDGTLYYGDYLSYQTVDEDSDGTADSVTITDCDESAIEIEIPAEIDGLPVTEIGKYAFFYCRSLTGVTIPDSVTSINDGAFDYCDELKAVTIPDSVTKIGEDAFASCETLTEIVIPDSVTEMEKLAFFGCTKLTDVTISKNLTSLESQVFSFCDSLKSVYIPDNITKLGDHVFWESPIEEINIPNTITEIGSNPFKDTPWMLEKFAENPMFIVNNILVDASKCEGAVVIPDGVTSIADSAFEGSAATSVTVPDSVTTLGVGAINRCDNLTSITLPDSITSMGTAALSSNDNLITAKLPAHLEELPENLFWSCEKLKSVKYPKNIKTIPSRMFYNCNSLTDIVIPDTVTAISDRAFYGCEKLENITIPETVTSIGDSVFEDTKWLVNKRLENPLVIVNNILVDGQTYSGELTIPENITKIAGNAFSQSQGLEKVIIPKHVTEIGAGAFACCYNLTDVTIENPYCVIDDSASVFTNTWGYASPNGMVPGKFNGIIYCYENSTAHEHAVKYNKSYTFIGSDIIYEPIVPEPLFTSVDPAMTSAVTWTSYTSTTQVSTSETSASTITTIIYPLTPYPVSTTVPTSENVDDNDIILSEPIGTNYTVRDCALIASALANGKADTLPKEADFNEDGIINIRDAATLAQTLANKQ